MKKLLSILTLSIFSICGFSQIQYELKGWSFNGLQKVSSDSISYDVPIIVVVGIKGDTYGFIAPNQKKNMFTVNLPFKVAQTEQAKYAYIKQEAIDYVAETYPNQ